MTRNARNAFRLLKTIKCPVLETTRSAEFLISAEDNIDTLWADFYGEFCGGYPTINNKIISILESKGLFAEWIDAGTIGVYPA
jgi:hypothetical protein